jgi:hypothetical protein
MTHTPTRLLCVGMHSGDSNYRNHPGMDGGGDRARMHGPRSYRFIDDRDTPRLGVRRGPTFKARGTVIIGSVSFPFPTNVVEPAPAGAARQHLQNTTARAADLAEQMTKMSELIGLCIGPSDEIVGVVPNSLQDIGQTSDGAKRRPVKAEGWAGA